MAFTNNNTCKSFATYLLGTGVHRLSAQECSEVVFVNNTAKSVKVFGGMTEEVQFGPDAAANVQQYIEVPTLDTFTFRGLTNCDQLTAASTNTGNDVVTYRAQFYGTLTER